MPLNGEVPPEGAGYPDASAKVVVSSLLSKEAGGLRDWLACPWNEEPPCQLPVQHFAQQMRQEGVCWQPADGHASARVMVLGGGHRRLRTP